MDHCSGARLLALAYSKIEDIDSLCTVSLAHNYSRSDLTSSIT